MQPLLKTHLKRGPMAKQRNHGKAEDTEAEKTVEHFDLFKGESPLWPLSRLNLANWAGESVGPNREQKRGLRIGFRLL